MTQIDNKTVSEELNEILKEVIQHYMEILRPGKYELSDNFTGEGIDTAKAKLQSLMLRERIDTAKSIEKQMGDKFDKLCRDVKSDPNLGNSTKSKKDNFLDGAELMLITPSIHVATLKSQVGEMQ